MTAQSLIGSLSFPSYLKAMRRADLAQDPRFANAEARLANQTALHEIVQTWILTFRDMESLDAQLDEAKIAMGQIRTLQALAETPWAEYWGAVHEVSDRRGGTYKLHGRPWRFSEGELAPPTDPAFRGEHNRQVLVELGYTPGQIDELAAAGVLVGYVPEPAAALPGH